MNPQSESFNENYATLKRIAEELSAEQDEPDIDGLVPRVKEALSAYQACRRRLEAVEQLLSEQLGDANSAVQTPATDRYPDAAQPAPVSFDDPAPEPPGNETDRAPPQGSETFDDDIPFARPVCLDGIPFGDDGAWFGNGYMNPYRK